MSVKIQDVAEPVPIFRTPRQRLPLFRMLSCVILVSSGAAIMGCGGGEPSGRGQLRPQRNAAVVADHAPDRGAQGRAETLDADSIKKTTPDTAAASPPPSEVPSAGSPAPRDASPRSGGPGEGGATPATRSGAAASLDARLAALEIPPPWLASVQTDYDTAHPWKEARLEIRRLLSLGKPETHRQALKLTWIYLQKNDIGDGHEYPMYTFLGGEPLWSIRAHEQFVRKPHAQTPIHSYLTLASLYAKYEEYERAKGCLDTAMAGLPGPPWRIMRQADVLAAYGDLYAAWGDLDEAKRCYAQAAGLYPTAKPPYGGHLLRRRAAKVQSKLDLLTARALGTTRLRDGRFQDRALGYAGDILVTVVVRGGKMVDIQIKHEEKIDQNASTIIPQRILQQQSLRVDGVSGATVTKDAIVNGVYRALRKAGLQ